MFDLWRKLQGWRRRDALDEELREELETHLRMKAEDLGDPNVAQKRFGNTALILEDSRSAWGWPALEALWQDLRYGSRMLLRSPGFTAVAVFSLAVGIGANTAIFSLVDRALIRTLPVEEPERLVLLSAATDRGVTRAFNYPDFADYRAGGEAFESLLCFTQRAVTLSEGDRAERVQGLIVSGNYFDALGVQLALGRGFLPEEDRTRGSHAVVVLGYGIWKRRFGGDPAVVGRTIDVNSYKFTVVGVAPAEFTGTVAGVAPDVYVPVMMQGQVSPGWKLDPLFGPRSRDLSWLEVMGRLKPGVTREQAAASMTILAAQVADAHPSFDGTRRPRPKIILQDGSRGLTYLLRDLRLPLQMLMATVGLILLMTCANVANLLLARAGARQKEIAIRLATGAGRMRLVRQLLTESLLLASLGGVAGLALAAAVGGLVAGLLPPDSLPALTVGNHLDVRVLGFTLGLSLLTGVLFGLTPAVATSRPNLLSGLKDEPMRFGARFRRLTLGNALAVGQVALAVMVLIGAGLCVRSLQKLQSVDLGFEAAKVIVMSADVSQSGYDNQRGQRFYEQLVGRVKQLPGVEAASLAGRLPLAPGAFNLQAKIEGYVPQPGEDMGFDFNIVAPEYFETLKIRVAQGREFTAIDTASSPLVAIVNETAARRFWSGQNALGRRISDSRSFTPEVREIIGVVRDSRFRQLSEDVRPAVYVPLSQDYRSNMALHVRTTGDPTSMLAAVRAEVQSLDPRLPLFDVRTLEEQKNGSLYTSRMAATLLSIFGLLALLLAATGLYGVMAYAVIRRKREIGIPVALGAQSRQVLQAIIAEGMRSVMFGLVIGLVGALAASRLITGLLYGVTPADPVSFSIAAGLLVAVALLANYLPARSASKSDPVIALRG